MTHEGPGPAGPNSRLPSAEEVEVYEHQLARARAILERSRRRESMTREQRAEDTRRRWAR